MIYRISSRWECVVEMRVVVGLNMSLFGCKQRLGKMRRRQWPVGPFHVGDLRQNKLWDSFSLCILIHSEGISGVLEPQAAIDIIPTTEPLYGTTLSLQEIFNWYKTYIGSHKQHSSLTWPVLPWVHILGGVRSFALRIYSLDAVWI